MKERVLDLNLNQAIEAFEAFKWKFYEDDDERSIIKVEAPRGAGETYVVELSYANNRERQSIINKLIAAGFIGQRIRIKSDW